MSTKSTISYSHHPEHDFHFYDEIFDEDAVYLELRGIAAAGFSVQHDQVIVRIPQEIWEVIRLRGATNLSQADWTDAQIQAFVEGEVDQRIEKYQDSLNPGEANNILRLAGCGVYGLADSPREDQIRAGIDYWQDERDRQLTIKNRAAKITKETEKWRRCEPQADSDSSSTT